MHTECPLHKIPLSFNSPECPHCGFIFHDNSKNHHHFGLKRRPSGIYDSYENAYQNLAVDDLSESLYSKDYQLDLARETVKYFDSVSNLDVAELGVGQGFLLRHLLLRQPKTLLALDIADEYVKNAKQIYKLSQNKTTSFITSIGNVEFMPYRESFDVVVATDILEHVINLGNALSRIHRMLKQNGRLWCRVPFQEVLGQYSIYNGQKYEFAHLRFFDKISLRAQLKEAGFESLSFRYFGYQPGRLKLGIHLAISKHLRNIFRTTGVYGTNSHFFNRKMMNPLHLPTRIFHQPMEMLVEAKKM